MKFTSDIVIGLEIHVELATDTKLFCSCPTHGTDEPNTRTCEICLGHPGSKPVLNKKVVEYALKLCMALNCKIAKQLVFSRKSYFYPDMSKNYQITQYELPLGEEGRLFLSSGKEVGITRVHLEEDPAALVHPGSMTDSAFVLVDYNRSGDPLAEIVTKPVLESPEEARDFMKQLISVLKYLKIFDVNRCLIKADANISIKESNYSRVEIKNITGFKDIERALKYEIQRQKQETSQGKTIKRETRGWDSVKGKTFSMRTKETEEDYGYIIDPDLVPIDMESKLLREIKKAIPELAHKKAKRFVKQHKLKEDDAKIIAAEKELAELFEELAKEIDPMLAAKWLRKELLRVLNYNKKELHEVKLDEKHVLELLQLVESNKITDNVAQKLLEELIVKPFSPKQRFEKEKDKLETVSDKAELEKYCKEVIENNLNVVEDVIAGKEKALNFLVGQVMRMTKGKAAPKEVKELFKKLIS